jgi:hypothetical protein
MLFVIMVICDLYNTMNDILIVYVMYATKT